MTFREHDKIQAAIRWHFQKKLRFYYRCNPATWAVQVRLNELLDDAE